MKDTATQALPTSPPRLARRLRWLPGTGLAALIAFAATAVSTLHGGPQFLYALLFGIAFHYLSDEPRTKPGIEFAARGVLRLGVGLLGARITVAQIASLGPTTALIVIFAVTTTIVLGLFLARRLGLTSARGILSGGSVAICGASAALAISAVLPREKEGDRFTLMVVVTVTVLSTVAMVAYPLIARALELPPAVAGLFLGGTIHDVAQVVGAGYMLGQETGDLAVIVKLFRVALLAVVVITVSAVFRRQLAEQAGQKPARQPLVPWFLWLFIALVAIGSFDLIPTRVVQGIDATSRACLVVAVSALGLKTSFASLARAGWKPFLLILVETLWIGAFVLTLALVG